MITFLAEVAQSPPAPVNSTPAWVIPLITGIATLLGAVVGGVASYVTSTTGHKNQAKVEAERAKNALIRDVSVRFLNESMVSTVGIIGLREKLTAAAELTEKLMTVTNADEVAELNAQMARINNPTDPVDMVTRSIRAVADSEERIAVVTTLLAEMRIVAPGEVVDKAQAVVWTLLKVTMHGSIAPLRKEASAEHKVAINAFVNEVRKYMQLPEHSLNDDNIDLPNPADVFRTA